MTHDTKKISARQGVKKRQVVRKRHLSGLLLLA